MPSFSRRRTRRAFTFAELLVTLAVVLVILVTVLQFSGSIAHVWKSSATDPFAEAQAAFENISRTLATATLEPYRDYADSSGAFRTGAPFVPDHLARRSDLAFACGTSGMLASRTTSGSGVFFLTPGGYSQTYARTGMSHLLNATGYFVEFGNDDTAPAFFTAHRWRWRLKEVCQPSESLQIYSTITSAAWIQQLVPAGTSVPVLAENIAALVVLPERAANDSGASLAPTFAYDSRDTSNPATLHQLPPRVRIALVALDEPSAQLLENRNGTQTPSLVPATLFQQAANLDADLATLDISLTTRKLGHRIYQREILIPSAAWANLAGP